MQDLPAGCGRFRYPQLARELVEEAPRLVSDEDDDAETRNMYQLLNAEKGRGIVIEHLMRVKPFASDEMSS